MGRDLRRRDAGGAGRGLGRRDADRAGQRRGVVWETGGRRGGASEAGRRRPAEPSRADGVAEGTGPARHAGRLRAQLVPACENGGGRGGVPGAAGGLVHSAVTENFRPGCQRRDRAVRSAWGVGGKEPRGARSGASRGAGGRESGSEGRGVFRRGTRVPCLPGNLALTCGAARSRSRAPPPRAFPCAASGSCAGKTRDPRRGWAVVPCRPVPGPALSRVAPGALGDFIFPPSPASSPVKPSNEAFS